MNRQELKFAYSLNKEINAEICRSHGWAGGLDIKLPYEGKEPTAYIIICHDMRLRKDFCDIDVGISAHAMALGFTELGFASCMIGSFSEKLISEILDLPGYIVPRLLLAVGAPAEKHRIVTAPSRRGDSLGSNTEYYRDSFDVHVIPKRSRGEIIISSRGGDYHSLAAGAGAMKVKEDID